MLILLYNSSPGRFFGGILLFRIRKDKTLLLITNFYFSMVEPVLCSKVYSRTTWQCVYYSWLNLVLFGSGRLWMRCTGASSI